MLEKISIYLLLISFALGHYPNIVISQTLGIQIPVYLYDIAVFIIFLQSLFLRSYRNFIIDLVILVFVTLHLLLLLFNTKFLLGLASVLYLARIAIYFFSYPFFICSSSKFKVKPLLLTIFLVFHLIVFSLFPNIILPGYDPHIFRLYGPFIDPNFYAVLLCVLLIWLISKKRNNPNWLSILNIFLTFLSIYLTFSRAGILLIFLILCAYFIKYKNFAFLPLLTGLILMILSSYKYLSRFLFLEGNRDSFFYRVFSYIEGIRIFEINFMPAGFNNIEIYKFYLTSNLNMATSYTDSLVLNLLLTGGFFNILFILILFFYIFSKKMHNYYYLILFILILSGFFQNTFFHSYFMIIYVLLLSRVVVEKKIS